MTILRPCCCAPSEAPSRTAGRLAAAPAEAALLALLATLLLLGAGPAARPRRLLPLAAALGTGPRGLDMLGEGGRGRRRRGQRRVEEQRGWVQCLRIRYASDRQSICPCACACSLFAVCVCVVCVCARGGPFVASSNGPRARTSAAVTTSCRSRRTHLIAPTATATASHCTALHRRSTTMSILSLDADENPSMHADSSVPQTITLISKEGRRLQVARQALMASELCKTTLEGGQLNARTLMQVMQAS